MSDIRLFSLFAMFLFASCEDTGLTASEDILDSPFLIRLGQSVILRPDNLHIQFQKVPNDSRCPSDVVCVWEGVAEMELLLAKPGSDQIKVTAPIPGYVTKIDTNRHIGVEALGYRIRVLQLDPYPRSENRSRASVYVALIQVSRL